MSEQIETAARAEYPGSAVKSEATGSTHYLTDPREAFAKGAAWQAAQPRTVSAADLDALAHTYCRAGVHGDELARALDSIGVSITVAEAGEVR